VLVIDDHEIQDLIQTIVQEHGFPVRAEKHGAEALKGETFCVILLDSPMPVMDGASFVRAYRALPGHQTQ